jgi:hypothetical protein
MNQEKVYTEQEMKMAILETHQSHAFKTMDRIETRIDSIETRMQSLQHWTIGLMFGLYAIILSTPLLPKLFHLFMN